MPLPVIAEIVASGVPAGGQGGQGAEPPPAMLIIFVPFTATTDAT